MSGDWDAKSHVRLLRKNSGALSLYTADLIEYLQKKVEDAQAVITIVENRAIAKERKRCLDIIEAEKEWGSSLDDAFSRVERGEIPRQIPGWNCPEGDEDW